MNKTTSEAFMQEARAALAKANELERSRRVEEADAQGAIAGNKIALALFAHRATIVEVPRWLTD